MNRRDMLKVTGNAAAMPDMKGKSHAEAAIIREGEAKEACKVTGSRPLFLNQIDGSTEVNRERYKEMLELDSWRRLGSSFALYYFEVMPGTQTQMFHLTDWVDITSTRARKHEACCCNAAEAFCHHIEPDSRYSYGDIHLYRPSQNRRKACRTVPKMEQNLQKAVPSVTKSVIFLPDALRLPAIDLLFPISRQWPR